MKNFTISLINFYQKNISLFLKHRCVFFPSCSEYGKVAIDKYGALKGTRLAFFRVLRCHPWQKNRIDLVE